MSAHVAVLLACGLASCRTAPPEARFACSADRECPPGMGCSDGLCYTSPPLARDASFDAVPDADRGLRDGGASDAAPGDAGITCPPLETRSVEEVTRHINTAAEWSCDTTYLLGVPISVSARLRIEQGTRIVTRDAGALIVQPEGRLLAVGTAAEPIVFAPASAAAQPWGGIVLLGRAPVNASADLVEYVPEPIARTYGGADPAHECGQLEYVRIEGSGVETTAGQRYPGLALAACGTATRVSHVQVHRTTADGIEIYGGTVRADHIVVTGYGENAIDWNYGWTGGMQFVITHGPGATGAALEGDSGQPDEAPRSSPRFHNVTLSGGNLATTAISVDSATELEMSNAVIAHWVGSVLTATMTAEIEPDRITIRNGIYWQYGTRLTVPIEAMSAIDGLWDPIDPMLRSLVSRPLDFEPMEAGGPTTMSAEAPVSPYDHTATFRGAMRYRDRWTDGWTTLE